MYLEVVPFVKYSSYLFNVKLIIVKVFVQFWVIVVFDKSSSTTTFRIESNFEIEDKYVSKL